MKKVIVCAAMILLAGLSACENVREETSEVTIEKAEETSDDISETLEVGNEEKPEEEEEAKREPEETANLEVTGDFEILSFEDPETGTALEYALYIPSDYSVSESYPLLTYIPDSSASGKSAGTILSEYYGATVFAGKEDQEKHPSFILVPAFSDTVVDDNWQVSDQVETAVKLINSLTETYSIDTDRLYITGQSMGCMTSLYLNSKYQDMFAASMFVSGQWDINVLGPLMDKKFFYIVAGGDEKASGGQDEVMALFDENDIPYSYGTWSAALSEEEQNQKVTELINEGEYANFIRFETGTVVSGSGDSNMLMQGTGGENGEMQPPAEEGMPQPERGIQNRNDSAEAGERGENGAPPMGRGRGNGQGNQGGMGSVSEHMASFDYAYRLTAVRDWLFEQSK